MTCSGRDVRIKLGLILLGFAMVTGGIVCPSADAIQLSYKGKPRVAFHGYLESNLIVRDQSGFQYGFMNDTAAVQQRNTLKFDVDGYIGLRFGDFGLDKVHFTCRAAYDTIFHLRYDTYKNIRKESPSRFDYGLYDIRQEADLREATLDLTYEGEYGDAFLRIGRQLVSWGETDGLTITDIINPPNNSFQMFFLNPDDLKTPLYMGRLNYNLPSIINQLMVNIDFVLIPDIRPQQWSVLYGDFEAPYISNHPFASFFGPESLFLRALGLGDLVDMGLTVPVLFDELGIEIREDVQTNDWEWGGRVTFNIASNLSVSASYFEGISDVPGFEFANWEYYNLVPFTNINIPIPIATRVQLRHPWTKTYGGSFNYYLRRPFDLILKGEFGRTENVPIMLWVSTLEIDLGPDIPVQDWAIRGFTTKPVNSFMIGFDKNVWMRWFSSNMVNFGFQYVYKQVCNWEPRLELSPLVDEYSHIFTFLATWWWWHGKINPTIFLMYDTENNVMVNGSVTWTVNKHLYTTLGMQSFWGDPDWYDKGDNSGFSKSAFSPFVTSTGEITAKVGFQW